MESRTPHETPQTAAHCTRDTIRVTTSHQRDTQTHKTHTLTHTDRTAFVGFFLLLVLFIRDFNKKKKNQEE